MMLQFARQRVAAVPAGVALTRALLANQGLRGRAGLPARPCGGPAGAARAVVNDLLAALSVGDELTTRRMLLGARRAGRRRPR